MELSLPSVVKQSLSDGSGPRNKSYMDDTAAREYAKRLIAGTNSAGRDNIFLPLTTYISKRKPPKIEKYSKLIMAGLTCREKRRCQLNKQSHLDLNLVCKMREMWLEYFKSCISPTEYLKPRDTIAQVDFIGCPIKVIRSNIANQIGMCGVIVQDNYNSFRIANESTGNIKLIAKGGTDVEIDRSIHGQKIVIFMSQMTFRVVERATRKFRNYAHPNVSFETLIEMWDCQQAEKLSNKS